MVAVARLAGGPPVDILSSAFTECGRPTGRRSALLPCERHSKLYKCFLSTMVMPKRPMSPVSSSVPESGTTVTELAVAAAHDAVVLEDELALASAQRPADALEGDVAGGALDGGAGAQHLPAARALEVSAELLLDRQASEVRVVSGGRRLWIQLHDERSARVCRS